MLYRTLQALVKPRTNKGGGQEVIIQEALFFDLIREALRAVPVDEKWYLDRNPDVRDAVSEGRISSAQDHFRREGYFEGRLPTAVGVDEDFYVRSNPDIAQAIDEGKISSVRDHFLNTGCREGRLPHKDFSIFIGKIG